MMMGMASTSTQPSGPPTTKVMVTKTMMKGRSETTDMLAEVKKSRTTSIWARVWA